MMWLPQTNDHEIDFAKMNDHALPGSDKYGKWLKVGTNASLKRTAEKLLQHNRYNFRSRAVKSITILYSRGFGITNVQWIIHHPFFTEDGLL